MNQGGVDCRRRHLREPAHFEKWPGLALLPAGTGNEQILWTNRKRTELMSETILTALIVLPIVIALVILFSFRGKGPSTLDDD